MRHSHRNDAARIGFTLIELLVVLGIISVLIAILLPVLIKVREHANRVKCAANLHSIGQGLTMYTQQYGYYPAMMLYPGNMMPARAIWPVRLRGMLNGEHGVFNCPSQDERCRWIKGATSPPERALANAVDAGYGYELGEPVLEMERTFFSYGYNFEGAQSAYGIAGRVNMGLGKLVVIMAPPGPDSGEVRVTRIRKPSEMIAIADTVADGKWDFGITPSPSSPSMNPGNVHAGGANVLFCDGHVQWYLQKDIVFRPEYLAGGEGALNQNSRLLARMWNNDNMSNLGN